MWSIVWLFLGIALSQTPDNGFHLVMMGARRGKGDLKSRLAGDNKKKSSSSPNQGRGQEITGVTLPAPGNIKGWEFGDGVTMACANVDGTYYAVQGDCPRCAFDLYKGDLLINDAAFEDLPRVACPTCSTTYGLRSGKVGPPFKRKGLAGFVGNLAKTATEGAAMKDAKAFIITREEKDGRVFIRERTGNR